MTRIFTRLAVVSVGALLAAAALFSQPSLAQAPAIALTGARLIDGTGRPPLEQATIVIANGRVQAVGAPNAVQIPAGAQRVDVAGKTIVPGFINAHGHVDATRKPEPTAESARAELLLSLKTYAQYGVTTVVSLGSGPGQDELQGIRLRDEQLKAPTLDRARLYTGGVNARGKTPEEARQSVDRLADLKVDIIKYHIDGNPNDMTPDTYGALVDESRKRGLRTSVHIFNLKDAKAAIEKGTDIIAHSVRDQDVDAELIDMMKKRDIGYIATLTRDLSVFIYESTPAFFSDPFFLRGKALYGKQMEMLRDPGYQAKVRADKQAQEIKVALKQALRNVKLLSDGGVTIGLGTDSGAVLIGRWQGYFEHTEMDLMAQAGMTPMQILVAATGGAARIMKLDANLGTLQPGKWADLVVLNANPLTDIKNTQKIDSVWIAGRRLTDMP